MLLTRKSGHQGKYLLFFYISAKGLRSVTQISELYQETGTRHKLLKQDTRYYIQYIPDARNLLFRRLEMAVCFVPGQITAPICPYMVG
jgi:hypothetical protein